MSAIDGSGWGFDHDWLYLDTPYAGVTHYKCNACGALFSHAYHSEPSIGKAMHSYGVAEHCPALAPARECDAARHTGCKCVPTKEMVDRFLSWRLPEDFAPDCGISFAQHHPNGTTRFEPIGTNLLTAEQAQAMLEHALGACECEAERLLRELAAAHRAYYTEPGAYNRLDDAWRSANAYLAEVKP